MTARKPWTDDECRAVVTLYLHMLNNATDGKPYNKAAMIREARTGLECRVPDAERCAHPGRPLAERSRGSIEAKLMNCSAAHADLVPDAVTMDGYGYRALSNYQKALKHALATEFSKRGLHRSDVARYFAGIAPADIDERLRMTL